MLGLSGCAQIESTGSIGVYGCVTVAPSVFLSEDDAFAIIKDEFEKIGLTAVKDGDIVSKISIPKVNLDIYIPGENEGVIQYEEGALTFDFAIQGKNINIEYVSQEDIELWNSEEGSIAVNTYNHKRAAEIIENALREVDSDTVYGVLYNPYEEVDIFSNRELLEVEKEAYERAGNELREQVTDFIEWLSAQGII